MPYKKLTIEREHGSDRFSVYLDTNKKGEHLRFEEAIELLKMIEIEQENE